MTKRLQVRLDEAEWDALRDSAHREDTTIAAYVRRALQSARRDAPRLARERKLAAIQAASRHAFPTADIDQMIAQSLE